MDLAETLAQERRARLAAERLLEQKQAELHIANRQLSSHAMALSVQVIEKREEVEEVRSENDRVRVDLQDATSRVMIAEQRLWDALETIQDGFAVFDSNDRLVAANGSWISAFDGLEEVRIGASYPEILGLGVGEGLFDIGDEPARVWLDRMLARWTSRRMEPVTIKLWNGAFFRLIDRRGEGGDIVSLALNITGQIRNESRLREARRRAEAANRAKSAFLANMSHELRTPMNGVVGMADILAETDLDDDQRSFVDTIRNSGEALLVIINDVLDMSKIDADRMTLAQTPFDLEQMLRDVILLLQGQIHGKNLALMLDYDLFTPTAVVGDIGRLRQILTNLVGNAVKFTEEGHVLIRVIGLPEGESDQCRLHITVEDSGIGIPEDKLDHVFGEFNQVEDDRNRRYDGTGLGLAITQRLVRLMGGEIWVDSEAGVGSSFGFHVTLPVTEPPRLPERAQSLKSLRIGVMAGADPGTRILADQLMAFGMKVEPLAAGDPVDGLAAIFVDGDMSDARNLVEQAAGVPLLMLASPRTESELIGRPGLKVLAKPVLRATLLDALSDLASPSVPQLSAPKAEVAPALPDPAEPETNDPGPALASASAGETAGSSVAREPAETAPLSQPTTAKPAQVTKAATQPTGAAGSAGSDPVPALPTRQSEAVRPPVSQLRQMRVLAAEDNKTNQLVLTKMLQALDIDLTMANNGREAVEMYQSLHPDLVFMDISMPEMDGKQATRAIRNLEMDGQHVPVVALTAHALTGDDTEILAAGLDYYLTKPLKKPAILERIAAACPPDCRPAIPDAAQASAGKSATG